MLLQVGIEEAEKTESVQAKQVFHLYAGISEAARGRFEEALGHLTVGRDLIAELAEALHDRISGTRIVHYPKPGKQKS